MAIDDAADDLDDIVNEEDAGDEEPDDGEDLVGDDMMKGQAGAIPHPLAVCMLTSTSLRGAVDPSGIYVYCASKGGFGRGSHGTLSSRSPKMSAGSFLLGDPKYDPPSISNLQMEATWLL